MVKLQWAIRTEKISLPSYPWSEVVIRLGLTVADQRDILKKYPNMTDQKSTDGINATMDMIVKCIVSWNFEWDQDWEILPITAENVSLFPSEDFAVLAWKIAEKKT